MLDLCTAETCYRTAPGYAALWSWALLVVAYSLWRQIPCSLRATRPSWMQTAMAMAALGTLIAFVPTLGAPTVADAEAALGFGSHSARALALLLAIDRYVYHRRPPPIPQATAC